MKGPRRESYWPKSLGKLTPLVSQWVLKTDAPFLYRVLANFKPHPDSVTASSEVKLVRYQQNPTAHWGPGTKAVAGAGKGNKRKREEDTA